MKKIFKQMKSSWGYPANLTMKLFKVNGPKKNAINQTINTYNPLLEGAKG